MPAAILIAEDQALIAELPATVLTAEGYTVRCVYDGSETLALATLVPPDLFLADV